MKIRTEEELLQLRTLNEGAITSSVGEYGSPEFSEVIDQLLVARMALKHIADTAGHQYSTKSAIIKVAEDALEGKYHEMPER